jgi:Tol biopolymer transport system component
VLPLRVSYEARLFDQTPADDGLLGWAPDGKHLLFSSDRSGTPDAWLASVSGGQPQGQPALVRKNTGDIESIGFTQSGNFYFHESIEGHNIYSARLDLNSGKLLSSPVENAGSYLGSNWRPDFSRDGKFLAYLSNHGSGEDQGNTIVIRSLETGKEQLLKPALDIGFALRWAPDGRSLFVNGTDKTKKEGLYLIFKLKQISLLSTTLLEYQGWYRRTQNLLHSSCRVWHYQWRPRV